MIKLKDIQIELPTIYFDVYFNGIFQFTITRIELDVLRLKIVEGSLSGYAIKINNRHSDLFNCSGLFKIRTTDGQLDRNLPTYKLGEFELSPTAESASIGILRWKASRKKQQSK